MHLQEVIFSGAYNDRQFVQNTWEILFVGNFFYLVGPFGFLFSMGCTIPFSRRNTPEANIRRGVSLLVLWFLLNACRGAFVAFVSMVFQGVPFLQSYFIFLFANDVLCFAGLFFLCYGLLKKRNLSFIQIFCVFFAAFAVAQFAGDFSHFLPSWSYRALAGIVDIKGYSSFPFLNWGLAVMLGVTWGRFLFEKTDKMRLYAAAAVVGLIISAITLTVMYRMGALQSQVLLRTISDPLAFHHANSVSVFCSTGGVLLLLGCFYFLSFILPEKVKTGISRVSGEILVIYIIHWLILPWLAFIPWLRNGRARIGKVLFVTLVLYLISLFLAIVYERIASAVKEKIHPADKQKRS